MRISLQIRHRQTEGKRVGKDITQTFIKRKQKWLY